MTRIMAQLVVAALMVMAVTAIAGVLLLHPGNISAESKDIVIGIAGGLTAGIGVATHSLFGNPLETQEKQQ